jgi:hypothetical protein
VRSLAGQYRLGLSQDRDLAAVPSLIRLWQRPRAWADAASSSAAAAAHADDADWNLAIS